MLPRRASGILEATATHVIVVLGFDQNETKQLLLGLGKGTVGHEDLSASHPHGGRRPNGLEGMSKDEVTARSEHVVVGPKSLAITDR
jgi:hypothetical protein